MTNNNNNNNNNTSNNNKSNNNSNSSSHHHHQQQMTTDHTTLLFRIGFFVTIICLASNFIYLGTLTHGTSEYDNYNEIQDHPPTTLVRRSSSSSSAETTTTTTTTITTKVDDDEQVLRKIFQRSISNLEFCQRLGQSKEQQQNFNGNNNNNNNNNENNDNDILLPAFGIINTLSTYFATYDDTSTTSTVVSCRKPPSTCCSNDCHDTNGGWTLITTSDAHRDMTHLINFLTRHASYHRTKEIILLWMSEREMLPENVLQMVAKTTKGDVPFRIVVVSEMVAAAEDDDAGRRFYRYHPSLQPLSSSLLYLDHFHDDDDDSRRFNLATLETGWELWKRHADIPIGSQLIGLTFNDDAEDDEQRLTTQLKRERRYRSKMTLTNNNGESTADNNNLAQFVPSCQSTAGNLSFDTSTSKDFDGYALRTTQGLFLHVDLACFIWHEAFREVRTLVSRRHDDGNDAAVALEDAMVSVLLTQVAGKGLRGYVHVMEEEEEEEESGETTVDKRDVRRRRLSREMNTTSISSSSSLSLVQSTLVEYFGSLHPGSVGWCLGSKTRHVVVVKGVDKKEKEEESCNNENVKVTDVPWMVKGGLGYDQC